ncbi:uncharacterized protein [Ptychodera flava]|uniref:uncharacterized protein n=1 Tax=Ptychodera flava TaxID=63121 RepID=UPI00396A955C
MSQCLPHYRSSMQRPGFSTHGRVQAKAADQSRVTLPAKLVQWSDDSITVEQLIEDYDLPQIIQVTIGWCGVDESSPDSLQGEEIVLFHEYITQNRIVAEDKYGQHLSISKDFAYKFEVIPDSNDTKKKKREPPPEPLSIPVLLERHDLPVKVRLAKKGGSYVKVSQPKFYDEVRDFGEITFLRPHSVNYLVGHCLLPHDLNAYCAIAVLPMPLEIEVAVGDIKTANGNKEWMKFVHKLSKMAKSSFNFEDFIAYQHDVYLLKAGEVPPEENEYDTIKPKFVQSGSSTPGGTRSSAPNVINTEYDDYRHLLMKNSWGASAGGDKKKCQKTLEAEGSQLNEAAKLLLESRDQQYEDPEDWIVKKKGPEGPAVPPRHSDPSAPPPRPPKPEKSNNTKPKPSDDTKPKPSNDTSEFPQDLRGLSIKEVCDVLRTLNLNEYVEQFRRNHIDGDMLCDITNDMLTEDMKMSKLHAMKLKKFIGGWRPNKEKGVK